MYSHIQYEFARQYHAELLRKAEQTRLAKQASSRRTLTLNNLLTQVGSMIANLQATVLKPTQISPQSQTRELACEGC